MATSGKAALTLSGGKDQTGPDVPRPGVTSPASDNAPFIMADVASAWGLCDGVGSVTLEARRVMNTAEGLRKDFVVTAHLRMSLPALLQLRDVIDALEVMARDEKAAELGALTRPTATH